MEKVLPVTAGVAVLLAVLVVAGTPTAVVWSKATATQSPTVPQWQIAAGGKMTFDVASVKPNNSGSMPTSNVPLDSQGLFTPTGGLFSATDFPLLEYTMFAYKLTRQQSQAFQSQLPKLVNTFRYDIGAHASGNPTKDQFRLK